MYQAVVLTPDLLNSIPSILESIAHLHASCILLDHTLATFLPPLNTASLIEWWEIRYAESQRGERTIIIILSEVADSSINMDLAMTGDVGIDALPGTVAGVVSLSTPFSQTGPFRGLVEKLFVSPSHRRLGLGKKLMKKLEEIALEKKRTLLMLDTTVGTPAELVYPRLGYRKLGVVEKYGLSPEDGRLVDEVWFWKDLNCHKAL